MKKVLITSLVLMTTINLTSTPIITDGKPSSTMNKEQENEDLVDIGGGISLNTREIGKGHATVVFDSGYGDGFSTIDGGNGEPIDNFLEIQNEIGKCTRTIAYERTGLGKSSDVGNMNNLTDSDRDILYNGGTIEYNKENFNGNKKTPKDKAINLYKMLKAKGIPAPYILVGHSLGGHTAIEFAKMYKEELAGVVFLDSTGRNAMGESMEFYEKYMPDIVEDVKKQFTKLDGTYDEVLMGENQVKHDENALKDIPILYLESDLGSILEGEIGEAWAKLRKSQVEDILSLSNYAQYKLIKGSGHYVHLDKPSEVKNEIMNFIYKVEYIK